MGSIIRLLVKWTLSVAAVAVIVLALVVGVARLLLPQVPEYREEIRAWAVAATGFDLEFDGIGASWPLSGPELHLYDVRLTRDDLAEFAVLADEVSVGVSILRFVREGRLIVGRFGLRGTSLGVSRDLDGAWSIQGVPAAELIPPSQSSKLPDLQVEIEDVQLRYQDMGSRELDEVFTFESAHADVVSGQVSLDGNMALGSSDQTRLEFSVDWGPPTGANKGGENGGLKRLYVAARDMEFARWQALAPDLRVPVSTARGDSTLWVDFAGDQPRSVTLELQLAPFVVALPERQPQVYDRIAGRLEWNRTATGWLVAATGLELDRGSSIWPESAFRVAATQAGAGERKLEVDIEFLRLDDLLPLIYALSTPEMRDGPLPRSLSGDVVDVSAAILADESGSNRYTVEAAFTGLGVAAPQMGVAFSNLSGQLTAGEQGGRLRVEAESPSIVLSRIFRSPLVFDQLDGNLVWRKTPSGLTFLSDRIEIDAGAMRASATLELEWPSGTAPMMLDLSANGSLSDARLATKYLPSERLPPKVVAWLDQAIQGGRIPRWEGTFNGALRDFPFDHGEGEFRIVGEMERVRLNFAPDWPPLENISATAVFDGVSLESTENRANFMGTTVTDSVVRMPDLRTGMLEVSTAGSLTVTEVLPIVRETPIADALGKTIESVVGAGPLETNLRLQLPLKRIQEWSMDGTAQLAGVEVGLEGFPHHLTELKGRLNLSRAGLSGSAIDGIFLGEPVVIDIRNDSDLPGVSHEAHARGRTSIGSVADAFKFPLPDYYDGSLDWESRAAIPEKALPGAIDSPPLEIMVSAALDDVESRLPPPLNKPRGEEDQLELGLVFASDRVIDMLGALGRGIGFALRLDGTGSGDEWSIERGSIHVGDTPPVIPARNGLDITGEFAELSVDDWLGLVDTRDREARWEQLYRELTVHVVDLAAFGFRVPDADVSATRAFDMWRIDIDSERVAGMIEIPFDADASRPVVIDMERLLLVEADEDADGQDANPAELPALRIAAREFVLKDMDFGTLEVQATPVAGGLSVDIISMNSDYFRIAGAGTWLQDPESGAQSSSLKLDFNSATFASALSALGYGPMIESKAASAHLDVSWPGPPAGTFLETAKGAFRVDVGAGQIIEIEPGAGRMFGLMSLSALPRRLALDFRDVFDKGLAFDRLTGEFTLDGGNAYTCNLGLVGSVANVGLVGRTGVAAQDYEQIAVVQPHLSNALPITGVVLGGPGAGAALWLISRIFRKPLSSIGESYYVVNGPWDDPVIESVQRSELDMTAFQDCEAYLAKVLPAGTAAAATGAGDGESGP